MALPLSWPTEGKAGEPAPDGATWPHCGHPLTEANTQSVGTTNGPRCRICRRKISRASAANRRGRQG